MKKLIFLVCLLFPHLASADSYYYNAARKALSPIVLNQSKEIESWIFKPTNTTLLSNPRINEILAKNQSALLWLRKAAQENNPGNLFGKKLPSWTPQSLLPNYGDYINLFRLDILDAKMNLGRGHFDVAEKDLIAAEEMMIQFSDEKYPPSILPLLVAQNGFGLSYNLLLNSFQVDPHPRYLNRSLALLNQLKNSQDCRKIFSRVTFQAKTSAHQLNAQAVGKNPFLNESGSFKAFYSKADADLDVLKNLSTQSCMNNNPGAVSVFLSQRPDISMEEAKLKALSQSKINRQKALQDYVILEAIKKTDAVSGRVFPGLITKYHVFLSGVNVLRVGLALELYRRKHGRLPRKLSQLVPVYLPVVPADSFNGFKPLIYLVKGKHFTVYSFGPWRKNVWGAVAFDWKSFLNSGSPKEPGNIVFHG